jgi:hypothetical protein
MRELTTTREKHNDLPEAAAHNAMSVEKRSWKDEERHLPQDVLQI